MGFDYILIFLRELLLHYGYWAVGGILLLENAGLPVPGETVLLLASFLAYSEHALQLKPIIAVAIIAATVGDNIGYFVGQAWGRTLLWRYRQSWFVGEGAVQRGEMLFARFGAVTILFARFIFGMRVIAGPMAGALRMPWKKFAIFNFLGATLWVTTISIVGYTFGSQWQQLLSLMKRFDLLFTALAVLLVLAFWLRNRQPRNR